MLLFVLETLESYAHSLIQSTKPSLLLVEDPRKEKVLNNFLISIDFYSYSLLEKGCMEVKRMEL
jgi:hypothetical protein